jgi:hypothetical protein
MLDGGTAGPIAVRRSGGIDVVQDPADTVHDEVFTDAIRGRRRVPQEGPAARLHAARCGSRPELLPVTLRVGTPTKRPIWHSLKSSAKYPSFAAGTSRPHPKNR